MKDVEKALFAPDLFRGIDYNKIQLRAGTTNTAANPIVSQLFQLCYSTFLE